MAWAGLGLSVRCRARRGAVLHSEEKAGPFSAAAPYREGAVPVGW
jgi:hypothetical protein